MISTLENSAAPVAFTHSSCYALVKNPRNVPEVVLDKLKENNGIIMISLIPPLTHSDTAVADVDNVVSQYFMRLRKLDLITLVWDRITMACLKQSMVRKTSRNGQI